jgi:RNA polymerase sigma factor FliA
MPDVERLWDAWLQSRDTGARDALVVKYWPLVRSVAAGVGRPRHLNLDELESHASLGLLDALDRYDPTKGPFEPYARARMRGAVIDGIREHDRASRTNLGRAKAYDTAADLLTTRLHRPPTDAELAAQLGVSVEGLRPFHHARLATTVGTLDPPVVGVGGDGDGLGCVPMEGNGNWFDDVSARAGHHDVAAEVEHRLRQATLAAALDRIDGPDRAVLVLYYVAEMTMSEIARVLGVATARVSQIHSRAVRELKSNLQPTLLTLEEQQ